MTVRAEGAVRRERVRDRDAALDALEAAAAAQSLDGRRGALDLRYRRFEPAQLVAARVQLRGPGAPWSTVRAGVDVRGDGSVQAWRGLVRKQLVEPEGDETPYAALRRELGR